MKSYKHLLSFKKRTPKVIQRLSGLLFPQGARLYPPLSQRTELLPSRAISAGPHGQGSTRSEMGCPTKSWGWCHYPIGLRWDCCAVSLESKASNKDHFQGLVSNGIFPVLNLIRTHLTSFLFVPFGMRIPCPYLTHQYLGKHIAYLVEAYL